MYRIMILCIILLGQWLGVRACVRADTVVPQIIGTNTTWTADGNSYLVQQNTLVDEGATLRIEPGVRVVFEGNYSLQVDGTLLAVGTETDRIVFTKGSSTSGWGGIRFTEKSRNNDQVIEFCEIEYAGYGIYYSPNITYQEPMTYTATFCNNRIENCHMAICLEWTGRHKEAVMVSHNIIQNNTTGVYCIESNTNTMIDWNKIICNNGNGIELNMYANVSCQLNVKYNTLTNNKGFGIVMLSRPGNSLITHNNIYNNDLDINPTSGLKKLSYSLPACYNSQKLDFVTTDFR